jgi:hypothetical protein
MPFFNSVIGPSLRSGNKCLIVSHANTIRTLIKQLDGISDEDIKGMSIPTGIPLLYRLDKNLRPVDPVRELEFRYMVEPKGYVAESELFLSSPLITAKSHSSFYSDTLGVPISNTASMAYTLAIWNGYKTFSESVTQQIATGSVLFFTILPRSFMKKLDPMRWRPLLNANQRFQRT